MAASDGAPPAVELLGITRRFGALLACDAIDLAVPMGQVHAVIGENGAGKTTLMNILFGLLQPDAGRIRIDGSAVAMTSPAVAIRHGLGMVHQHFKLVPSLSVAENVFLGMETMRAGLIDHAGQIARTAELSRRFGLSVAPRDRVGLLSVGIQQRIEILKVLVRGARTIILDEPTAVLTPQETRELFRTLRDFVAGGMTIILITHHLEEVMEVSDAVTVLRQGRRIASLPTASVRKDELVRMMVGRSVSFARRKREPVTADAPTLLAVEHLWTRNDRGMPALRDVSFGVRAGEILGIAGVAGNGQTELAEVLAGLRPATHGSVALHGSDVTGYPPRARREAGLGHVPGDRMARGVDRDASIAANLLMGSQDQAPWSRLGVIGWRAVRKRASGLIAAFDIRAPGPDEAVKNLSGGNIQKVVLAREFSGSASVLLVDQPTRGVDIGATDAIHAEIMRKRDAGCAILLISLQLDELLTLADRILVLFAGAIAGSLIGEQASEDEIGLLMAGLQPARAAA